MSASILINPKCLNRQYPDQISREIMEKTIAFFENKGKRKLKEDDHSRTWYADFLDFIKEEKIFYTLLTPSEYGKGETRWDTWRNCEFNEILAFYGLTYWYTWQVTILGLGPIWKSTNTEPLIGSINLIHAIPANKTIYQQLLTINDWDTVNIVGREIYSVKSYDMDDIFLGTWIDTGCNTLLVDSVTVLYNPDR